MTQKFIKQHGWFAIGILYFLFIFFKNAWVADDAYIAFRSVEQLFAGNGPRWNIDERVQVYTSPLWYLLLCVTRIFSADLFINSVLLSAACCVGALWIARETINNDKGWLVFVLLISGSWAVMDFTSSGLENPLLYLLLTCYLCFYVYFFDVNSTEDKRKYLCGIMICVGLLSITRHDVATLIFIPSLFVFYKAWRTLSFSFVIKKSYLMWLPLMAWTTFSIIYYGAPFPNTAYAKIMHGIQRADLMDFGKLYLLVSIQWDYFVQACLLSLLAAVLWKRETSLIFIFLGILLNLFYVVYVGGDFMQGRFISAPVFLAALVATVYIKLSNRWFYAFFVIMLLATIYLHTPIKQAANDGFDLNEGKRHFSWNGILNERNFYFLTNSMWAWWHRDENKIFPEHKWCEMGRHASQSGKQVSDFGGIGMYGYCAGLDLIVIDRLALGEPFLARLPMPEEKAWRAGHFHRDYPQGFYESRVSGNNSLVEPHLRALWEDVVLATREPLFTKARWKAIWRINSGAYKNIDSYYFKDLTKQKISLSD